MPTKFKSPAKERPSKSPAKERPKKVRPDTPGKSPRKPRPTGLVAARWTPEEEARLRALVLQYSGERGKWKVIAEELGTGRTGAAVQQHYAKHMQGDIDDMAELDSPAPAAPTPIAKSPIAKSTAVVPAVPTAKRSMLPMAGAAPPPSAILCPFLFSPPSPPTAAQDSSVLHGWQVWLLRSWLRWARTTSPSWTSYREPFRMSRCSELPCRHLRNCCLLIRVTCTPARDPASP